MYYKDGIYKISQVEEDDFGPPQPGEEDEELALIPLGKIQLKGDTVINLANNEDIQYLMDTVFKREHRMVKGISTQNHVSVKLGEAGYGQAFMEMLGFLDYWYDLEEEKK